MWRDGAQEKARLKAEKEAAEDKYKWATVDGRREQARGCSLHVSDAPKRLLLPLVLGMQVARAGCMSHPLPMAAAVLSDTRWEHPFFLWRQVYQGLGF